MTTLAITAAGRAALADQTNVGVAAVRLTHLELGDGRRGAGDSDDARTALRSRRVRGPVVGREAAGGRVAAVLDVAAPGWTGDVTEIGLVGNDGGDELLLAYWAASAGDAAPFASHATTRLVVGVTLDVSDASADVDVTVSPSVTFGPSEAALEALTARVAALEGEEGMRVCIAHLVEGAAQVTTVVDGGGNVDGWAVAANGRSWTVPAGTWWVQWEGDPPPRIADGDGGTLLVARGTYWWTERVLTLAAARSYTPGVFPGADSAHRSGSVSFRKID